MKHSFFVRERYRPPQWRIFLTFSVVIHVLAVALIFYVPQAKKDSGTPFITRLVSPEEMSKLFQEEPSASGFPKRELKTRPSLPVPAPSTAKPSVPRREAPAASSSVVRPGPREAERGPAPAVGSPGMKNKEMPGQEATSVVPGGSIPRGGESAGVQGGPAVMPSPSLKDKLFDREIVEKYAKREESTRDNGITFDTREFKYQAYMRRLKERIERIWEYPPEAARRGIHGDLIIEFTINKNGTLGDVELLRGSGYPDLDKAAMQALKDGQPYWPLPDEWRRDTFPVTGHFVYSIYGAYIR